jgi:mono/diheme cytochrome c family protein
MLYRPLVRIRERSVAPVGGLWIQTRVFDPPEARRREGYDKILRLTPGNGIASTDSIPQSNDADLMKISAADVFAARCVGCHGTADAPGLHSSLFDGKWILGSSDSDLTKRIHDGLPDRGMPAYGQLLTEAQIADLVKYIREREQQAARARAK